MIFQTLAFFILFIFIFLILFYPFGYLLISKIKAELTDYEIVLLSLIPPIVIFVILAMLFGVLNIRFLLFPLFLIVDIYSIFLFRQKLFQPIFRIFKDWVFSIIVLICLLVQGFINFPSGFKYSGGYLFWSSQGNDGLWHVALMEEAKKTMPLLNPIYSGDKLFNYHYLVDVLMGEFGRIFPFFSSLDLYFRFFTVIFSFLIILSVFTFVTRWQNNKKIGYLAVFFTILSGSFGYIVTLIRNGKLFSGETVFWAAQGNSIIGNPPHAISYSLIATSLLCLYFYFRTHKNSWFLYTFLISSMLAGFKIPGGFVFLAGLGCACIVDFFLSKNYKSLLLVILTGITNFSVVRFLTRGASSFLIFEPWWFIRTMVVVPERLGMIMMEFKRQHYLAQHTWHANLRVLQLELGALFIFVIGNLGMKILGIREIYKKFLFNPIKTIKEPLEVMLFISMLTGLIMPLLFVQKGIAYNNIAFMQYFILIFGFYAAVTTYKLLTVVRPIFLKIIIVVVIICLSVPTVIGNLVDFYSRPALAKISNAEIEALNYLKINAQLDNVVLTLPFDKDTSSQFKNQPWPIGVWYPTSYVSALAGVRTYLSSELQSVITGYEIDQRLVDENKFFSEKDVLWNKSFLLDNGIKYIYLTKFQKEKIEIPEEYVKAVFENSEVTIYQTI